VCPTGPNNNKSQALCRELRSQVHKYRIVRLEITINRNIFFRHGIVGKSLVNFCYVLDPAKWRNIHQDNASEALWVFYTVPSHQG